MPQCLREKLMRVGDCVSQAFALTRDQYREGVWNPISAYPQWKEHLHKYRARVKKRAIKGWRTDLTQKGRPTRETLQVVEG